MEILMKDKTTTTTTRIDVHKALEKCTPEEERVLRMRRGISEKPSAELQQKPMPNDEVRVKLAMITKMAMERLEGRQQATDQVEPAITSTPRKDHIIERLRRAKRDSQ